MCALLSLLSKRVRVHTLDNGSYGVFNMALLVRVFPTYELARNYAHGLVNYIERQEDLEEI